MDGGDNGRGLKSCGGLFVSHLAADVSYWLGTQLGLSIEASAHTAWTFLERRDLTWQLRASID